MFKLHHVSRIEAGSTSTPVLKRRIHKCPEHDQELNVFCKQEAEVVCSHCVVMGAHKGHDCVSLAAQAIESRSNIVTSNTAVKKVNTELAENHLVLINLLDEVRKNAKDRRSELDSSESEIINAIRQRFSELRDKVARIEREKTDCLTRHADYINATIEKNKMLLEASKRALESSDDYSVVSVSNKLEQEVRTSAQNKKLNVHEPRENEAIDIHVVTDRILSVMHSSWDVYKTENPVVIDITPAESNWFDETTINVHGRHFGGNDRQKIRVVVGDKECTSVRVVREGNWIECKVPPGTRGTTGKVVVYVNGQRSKENVQYHWGVNSGMPSWMET